MKILHLLHMGMGGARNIFTPKSYLPIPRSFLSHNVLELALEWPCNKSPWMSMICVPFLKSHMHSFTNTYALASLHKFGSNGFTKN
jgi:hypothetical protein